jgi:hypothetical protein
MQLRGTLLVVGRGGSSAEAIQIWFAMQFLFSVLVTYGLHLNLFLRLCVCGCIGLCAFLWLLDASAGTSVRDRRRGLSRLPPESPLSTSARTTSSLQVLGCLCLFVSLSVITDQYAVI